MRILKLLPLSLLNCVHAMAQSDTLQLAEVSVIEATKPQTDLLPLTVSIISGETIENSEESSVLPVLMNRVPGLFVTERGMGGYGVSNGSAGGVSIRGVGTGDGFSNKVLFMIDGQPQWAGVFGHSLPDTYVSNDVERIEVVRGPSSLLYGSGAMGGSVNIVTRHAKADGMSGNVRMMWGSYGTQKYSVNAGYRHKRLNTFVSAMYERSDGHRPNMQYWLANQFASVDYKLRNNWSVGANLTLTETTPHNAGKVQTPLTDMWVKMFRGTASVYIKNRYDLITGGLQAYVNWGRHKISDGYASGQSPRDYLFRSNDDNIGITAYETLTAWEGNNLSAGIDFKRWGGRTWNEPFDGSEPKPGVEKHVNEIAGYLMMQQSLCDDVVSLNAGIRTEHSSQFGNEVVPQAGFIIKAIRDNTIKFSWGKGFRSPNIKELYMYQAANAELKPEYLWNYEVEIKQALLDNRLTATMSLYFIDGKDMIQTVVTDGRPKNMNTGRFINKGLELSAAYNSGKNWSFTASYSYLNTNAVLLAAPKNKLFAEARFVSRQWELGLESLSVFGLRTSIDNVPDANEKYSVLNARVSYDIKPMTKLPIKLFVKGDNLTDTSYETMYGFPMPGITVMGGVMVRF